ncbi:hypothetical protein IKJ53_07635 [bacterium]|nr:hypothetical protein [bacterium]
MDNFHFINVKPNIEKKDVALIKETIFQRARDKAEKMNEVQNEQYTSQIKNDIMEIASADFRSTEFNPFNQFKQNISLEPKNTVENKEIIQEPIKEQEKETKTLESRFKKITNYSDSVKDETMDIARKQFSQQQNLMTSLNFLNAKAAVQMAKYAHSKINYMS